GATSYLHVIGVEGQSVRLPCSYEGKVTSTCWGRGECSWLDCRNTIISTEENKVTERKNKRYKLKGNIGGRDVSLTIENAVPSDSGLYCCHIKKWFFNDEKNIIKLTIKPAPPTTTVNPSTESTRTSSTETPRTASTTSPAGNSTVPERGSATIVATSPHVTTRASTSALPMPTPTKDLKPGKHDSHYHYTLLHSPFGRASVLSSIPSLFLLFLLVVEILLHKLNPIFHSCHSCSFFIFHHADCRNPLPVCVSSKLQRLHRAMMPESHLSGLKPHKANGLSPEGILVTMWPITYFC
ncbi:hypothetical protein FD755_000632, partial [Muntiacus reevesi]